MIRKSTEADRGVVQGLIQLGFGDRYESRTLNDLDGRYYLYFKDDILVAMTGISYSEEYRSLEVDWTCTHPDYRHQGFMQELFTEMLRGVEEDVYCSCWHLPDRDEVNLHTIMSLFGFREVVRPRVHWKVPYNCSRNYEGGCTHCTGSNCECYEDLYLRKAQECKKN